MTAIFVMLGLVAVAAVAAGLGIGQIYSMGWGGAGANTITSAITFTGDTVVMTEFTIPSGNVADQEQIIGIDVSGLKALEIIITGNTLGSVTMETNDGSSPDDTMIWAASADGGRYLWDSTFPTLDAATLMPFDADVTTTFWTHNAAEEVTVKIRATYNG